MFGLSFAWSSNVGHSLEPLIRPGTSPLLITPSLRALTATDISPSSLALLLLLCRQLLLLRDTVRRLPSIQRTRTKHHRSADLHKSAHLVTKDPYAQQETDQLANVQYYRDSDRRSVSAENIDTRDAKQLCNRVGSEVYDVLRCGCQGLVECRRQLRGDARWDRKWLRGL
jgi:hypothetical protein